jgi:DNA-nicking Smr family endonuclease
MRPTDKSRRRKLSDEEQALWRGVTKSVKPLKRRKRQAVAVDDAPANAETAATEATMRPSASRQPMPTARRAAPQLPPLAPLQRREKQRLARGVDAIDARLDLHGYTQSDAHAALIRFLRRAQSDGARLVLVVTGKGGIGDADSGRGVLRRQVPMWLALPEFRSLVVGFDEASVTHGGQGALYVRLRRGR